LGGEKAAPNSIDGPVWQTETARAETVL